MNCRKCDSLGTVIIRKEYCYCDNCFIINTNHKFRACLGKSKTLSSNEKTLICLSGNASSAVLLDLVHSGISLNGTKTLRIHPYFLHIVETSTESDTEKAISLIDQCNKYGFDIYAISINEYEYYSTKSLLPEPNMLPTKNSDAVNHIKPYVPSTINHDVIIKMKRSIFLRIAKELCCKYILTAETTTKLAMTLLSNIAIGRGAQVENDVGFADKRHEYIKILRPMRDISNEEIDYFVKIKQLKSTSNNNKELSLQAIIDNFVLHLQENYPSTISTVCKTADKIASLTTTSSGKNCRLCQSNIEVTNAKLTAVEATIFSQQMCFNQIGANEKIEYTHPCTNEEKNSMFPGIYETLCYSCSRHFSEIDKCTFQ